MKFVFIAKHRNIWPVVWLCDALGVSRSGFDAWLNRSPSVRSQSDEAFGQRVKASFITSDRTCGARRVWRDLLAEGVACGLHRVERLMRLQALRARPCRRRSPKDEGDRQVATAPSNLLDRQFDGRATEPEMDRRLHLHLDGRGLALCGGRDRPVLAPGGRLVDERAGMTAQLVADALKPLGRCRATITMDH
jgi:putative transposase